MTYIDFDTAITPLASRLRAVLLTSVAAGTSDQKKRAVYDMAQLYRHGTSLTRADTAPGAVGGTVRPLDYVESAVALSVPSLQEAVLEASATYAATGPYIATFEEDLLSDVVGRRVCAACALVCFLSRRES
jgi:hypothetical protein